MLKCALEPLRKTSRRPETHCEVSSLLSACCQVFRFVGSVHVKWGGCRIYVFGFFGCLVLFMLRGGGGAAELCFFAIIPRVVKLLCFRVPLSRLVEWEQAGKSKLLV